MFLNESQEIYFSVYSKIGYLYLSKCGCDMASMHIRTIAR